MKTSKYAQFAAGISRRTFVGELIKFRKGCFEAGRDQVPISPDQRFVAVMSTLTVGHIKWFAGKPVDSRMGLVADGFEPQHRSELDDFDSKNWEVDENSDRIDPWQKINSFGLIGRAAPHDVYTFSTNTEGGAGAIGALCEAHARTTEGAGQYPVVTLASDSYSHKTKAYGRVHVPVFKIVDCVEAAPFDAIVAEARGGAGFIPASPAEAIERPARPVITSGLRTPPVPPEPPIEDDGPPEPRPIETNDWPGELDDQMPF